MNRKTIGFFNFYLQMNGWHDFAEYMRQWLLEACAIPMRRL